MLNARCSFLHFILTLSEIPTEQIFKQSLLIKLPFLTHGKPVKAQMFTNPKQSRRTT